KSKNLRIKVNVRCHKFISIEKPFRLGHTCTPERASVQMQRKYFTFVAIKAIDAFMGVSYARYVVLFLMTKISRCSFEK
ncbi:hypothetical protein L9F63_001051, partial [Diploptera punctata]